MIRIRKWIWTVPLLALSSSGCSDANWWQTEQEAAATVAQDDASASAETQAETPPAETADPHAAATNEMVKQFLERLDGRADRVVAQREEETPVTPEPQQPARPEPEPESSAAANLPYDLDDMTEPVSGEPLAAPAPQLTKPVIEAVFVRHSTSDLPVTADSEPTSTTNSPLSAAQAPQSALSVDDLIAALERQVSEHPQDLAARWQLHMLRLAVGDDTAARDVGQGMDDESAGLLGKLMGAIIATRNALESPVIESDAALVATRGLYTALQERSELRIPAVELCTRVQTFGVYDVMPDEALVANRANRAIVYIEIDNFLSEKTTAGQYRTTLSGELEVLTSAGQAIWQHQEPSIVDMSRQRRRDFFLAQMITLPASLGPGEYVLKVSIQDELSGKSTQAIHNFAIGGAAAHASNY